MTDEARAKLKQRVLDSLFVYHDRRIEGEHVVAYDYLRFIPLDSRPSFGHGISTGVRVSRGPNGLEHDLEAKEAVADYLVDCIESLLEDS